MWWGTFIGVCVLSLALVFQSGLYKALASPPSLISIKGHVPDVVSKGKAHLASHHKVNDRLLLAVGLQLRNKQGLQKFLKQASDPNSPRFGKYLTQAQANQLFNPTPQQEQQVVNWLKVNGLTVTHTYSNHMLVDASGSTTRVEQMLHLTINDYTVTNNGKQIIFYAPASEPLVDSTIGTLIAGIAGLDDFPRFRMDTPRFAPGGSHIHPYGIAHNTPPYYPQDFANAYNVTSLWNAEYTGVNQSIAITLWSVPPTDGTLQYFNGLTGSNVPLQANKRLYVIQVDGGTTNPDTGEASIDIEYAGGMAPDANINYYEMATTVINNVVQPTAQAMEDAINWAGSSGNQQITNSWSYCEPSTLDSVTQTIDNYLMTNTSTGHTYFFSSGDLGSSCQGSNPLANYPASSDYSTAVGGTSLTLTSAGKYQPEAAWSGSGGGFSTLFPRPWWQVASGIPNTTRRGIPDIAANADPNTAAYVCFGNNITCGAYGNGTSLASPLWAGMLADVNQYLQTNAQSVAGFVNPTLYWLANSPQANPAYHDIINGSNGSYSAGSGWDPVTGLGTPNLYNIACDIAKLCTWQIVPSLNEGSSNNYLYGVTEISSTNAWAVGYYGYNQQQTQIQHWDGNQWRVVASPNGSSNNLLYGVSGDSANDVWAVGYSNGYQALIEHWDGTQWSIIPNPAGEGSNVTGALYSVAAISPTDAWAVGNYYNTGVNTYQTLAEHWNGSQWSIVPSPNPVPTAAGWNQLSYVKAISSTDVWAVGYYYTGSGQVTSYQTLAEHWNGSQWSIVTSPNGGASNGVFNSVTANSSTDVWAVGTYYKNPTSTSPLPQTLIEHWNGTQWSVVASPNVRLTLNYLNGATAISSNAVWAVGYYYNSSIGRYNTLTELWNGKAWTFMPSPNYLNTYNELNAVAGSSGGQVWAVGWYNGPYCCVSTLIEVH
jgi:subtilase family serine protease